MNSRAKKKILIIIQRSNGDVFLSTPLIDNLTALYGSVAIDLLVNDDTVPTARTIGNISNIHSFSYKAGRIHESIRIIKTVYKKYDLCINLTASDRAVFFAILAGRSCISAIDKKRSRSWWKKIFLEDSYEFDTSRHIVLNNTKSLELLGAEKRKTTVTPRRFPAEETSMRKRLEKLGIGKFIIFHPSAQYEYKMYPSHLRTRLLELLHTLDIPVIVTGGKSRLDSTIKGELPDLHNVHDFIGTTSLEELTALSNLSIAYIGNDTLNMHIAASQNKRIFAIFGPTILKSWSPWSNELQRSAVDDMPAQTYGNVTIFQAAMPCVACGLAGCDDNHGPSECLYNIDPSMIYTEVKQWLKTLR
ncbi:MAG: lipopolysaccharide heptosyltransferase [Chlorobiales bacterium]|nr:lipopolysaccharide heptosyltransferase [Chlorobiales bacterium]